MTLTDGSLVPAKLECMKWGESPLVTFADTMGGQVLITIGDTKALIKRSELAAAATLLPAEPPSIRVR